MTNIRICKLGPASTKILGWGGEKKKRKSVVKTEVAHELVYPAYGELSSRSVLRIVLSVWGEPSRPSSDLCL